MTSKPLTRRWILPAACLVVLSLTFVGCKGERYDSPTAPWDTVVGSGNLVQEPRPAFGISGVRLEGIGTIEIVQGSNESLIVEAEDNLIQYLRTEVVGGILIISKDPNVNLRPRRDIVYQLTAPRIDRVDLTGVGDIRCHGLAGDRLELSTFGVGGIDFSELQVHELDVTVSGVGNVRASGTTTSQRVTMTGVGEYAARNLESVEANVDLRAVGSATVRVSQRLIATVAGAGCLYYIGDPEIDSHLIGAGCLRKIG